MNPVPAACWSGVFYFWRTAHLKSFWVWRCFGTPTCAAAGRCLPAKAGQQQYGKFSKAEFEDQLSRHSAASLWNARHYLFDFFPPDIPARAGQGRAPQAASSIRPCPHFVAGRTNLICDPLTVSFRAAGRALPFHVFCQRKRQIGLGPIN